MLKNIWKYTFSFVLVFGLTEALIRVAYFVRNATVDVIPNVILTSGDYGPKPPWMKWLGLYGSCPAGFEPSWMYCLRPNLVRTYVDVFDAAHSEEDRRSLFRRFAPSLPEHIKQEPTWTVSTNSHGFRDQEFSESNDSSSFRILALGDSWTFGTNVDQEEAYPQRLRRLLMQEYPNVSIDVLNLGVPGYDSYLGSKLFKQTLSLDPDLVVIGFAMNEFGATGMRDLDDKPREEATTTNFAEIIEDVLDEIQIYNLLYYWAQLINWKPKSITEHYSHFSSWVREMEDRENLPEYMQDTVRDYKLNILEIIEMARMKNAAVILLYPEFWTRSPLLNALLEISRDFEVPIVDASALLAEAKRNVEMRVETNLGLDGLKRGGSTRGGEVEVVFRVYSENRSDAKPVFISGSDEQLADWNPNTITMFDDGSHGDERAGDNVWSYSALFKMGETVFYTFTNGELKGEWVGLDVPAIRRFDIDADIGGPRIYAPIDTFGKIYMHSDPWHTNAVGNDIIARAILKVLKNTEKSRSYLAASSAK